MKKYELEDNEENIEITIKENVLNRNNKLVMLCKMLTNLDDNYNITIDGAWGSGKTFFVKQFKYIIEHINDYKDNFVFNENDKDVIKKCAENNLVIYYNAWENDDHESHPLESIIYSILNDYPKYKQTLPDFSEFKKLFKSAIRDIIYVGTAEIIDLNNIDKMNSFEDYAKKIKTIDEKKESFNKLINLLLNDNQRLILIIDELDRCKPTFAIQLLETIKHFYNNKKITILMSTNNFELSHTIKKVYGQDFDGYSYLNKFYDCIIYLDNTEQVVNNYLKNKLIFNSSGYTSQKIANILINYYHLSLRECNKYVSIYSLLFNYIDIDFSYYNYDDYKYVYTNILLPLAIIYKIKNIELYNKFINNNATEEITSVMNFLSDNDIFNQYVNDIIRLKPDELIVDKVIEAYHNIFTTQKGFKKFPFFEALSMLGTNMNFE